MRRFKTLSVICTCLICAVFGAVFWFGFGQRPSFANDVLSIDSGYLELGQVWETDTLDWTVPIHNPTASDVEVDGFTSSCHCLSIKPNSFVLQSGDTQNITVTMSLRLGPIKPGEDRNGKPIAVSFFPQIRSVQQQQGWTLTGRVRRVFVLDPYVVDFGTVYEDRPLPSKSIVAVSNATLAGLEVSCPPSMARATLINSEPRENRFEVEITLLNGIVPGPFNFDLKLQPITAKADAIPIVNVRVEGVLKQDVQALPPRLLLGAKPIGESVTETVLLRSETDKLFEIQSIDVPSEDTVVRIGPSEHSFQVTQRISTSGNQDHVIKITIVSLERKTTTLSFNVTYVGLTSAQGPGSVPEPGLSRSP